jgi:integrase/recombinase XerD
MKNIPKKSIKTRTYQPITLDETIERFIAKKKSNNLTSSTLKYYTDSIHYFIKKTNISTLNQINEDSVIDFINQFDEKVKTATINSYLRGLKTYVKYLIEQEYIEAFDIQLLKQEEIIKDTYSEKELRILLKKPNTKTCTFNEYRTWTVINFCMATGARLSTIINIRVCDLDLDANMVIYRHTKNKRQQIIPISKTLHQVLVEYLTFRNASNEEDYLFCNAHGQKISIRSLQDSVSDYNHSRNVNKTSIHMFRHTFAKITVINGIDPFRLQKILGHSTLDMTRKYCNLYSTDLVEGFNDYNPLEKFTSFRGNTIKMK